MPRPCEALETIEKTRPYHIGEGFAPVHPEKRANILFQENFKYYSSYVLKNCSFIDTDTKKTLLDKTAANLQQQTDRDVPISAIYNWLHKFVDKSTNRVKSASRLRFHIMPLTISLFYGENLPADIEFVKECLEKQLNGKGNNS